MAISCAGIFVCIKLKHLKIQLYLVIVFICAPFSYASSQKATIRFTAGINRFGTQEAFHEPKYRSRLRTGFNAGLNAEIGIAGKFNLQPGLLFVTKGSRSYEETTMSRVAYVELPVNLIYKLWLGSRKLIVGAGPYAAVAVGGSWKDNTLDTESDIRFDNDITISQVGQGIDYLRRFDTGINGLVGYEVSSKVSFQLNGQLGLLDAAPLLEGDSYFYQRKNFGFGISMGYHF